MTFRIIAIGKNSELPYDAAQRLAPNVIPFPRKPRPKTDEERALADAGYMPIDEYLR